MEPLGSFAKGMGLPVPIDRPETRLWSLRYIRLHFAD
jgi:hypothetical protein